MLKYPGTDLSEHNQISVDIFKNPTVDKISKVSRIILRSTTSHICHAIKKNEEIQTAVSSAGAKVSDCGAASRSASKKHRWILLKAVSVYPHYRSQIKSDT